MYPVNFYSIIASSFIPLFIGMIWYNPKVFGTIWMKASGVDPEAAQKSSMILVFGLTWIFSLFVAFILGTMDSALACDGNIHLGIRSSCICEIRPLTFRKSSFLKDDSRA